MPLGGTARAGQGPRGYLGRVDVLQWVPLLGALGVGSVIGNYVGTGRARREVRSGVLKSITATESKRWAGSSEYTDFVTAVRDLETAALIVRVPRHAVRHYLVLADAARHLSDESFEERDGDEEMGAGGIDGYFADVVRDAAEVITRLAWRPWWARVSLRRDLKSLRSRAEGFDENDIKRKLASGQRAHGALPGPLGELPGINAP
jgi:hypothetical protein